ACSACFSRSLFSSHFAMPGMILAPKRGAGQEAGLTDDMLEYLGLMRHAQQNPSSVLFANSQSVRPPIVVLQVVQVQIFQAFRGPAREGLPCLSVGIAGFATVQNPAAQAGQLL